MDAATADRAAQKSRGSKIPNSAVGLGREFHADLLFYGSGLSITNNYKKVKGLSSPCYTAMQRLAKRHYLSEASFKTVGGFASTGRYFGDTKSLRRKLTAELKRKADRRATYTITIHVLGSLGIVATAWAKLALVADRANAKWDPILMRGDNTAAVSWISRGGGGEGQTSIITHENAGAIIKGAWNHIEKHIPDVRKTLPDGISSPWPRVIPADKARDLTNNSNEWSEQNIGTRGKGNFDTLLQTKNIFSKPDDCLWDIMSGVQAG